MTVHVAGPAVLRDRRVARRTLAERMIRAGHRPQRLPPTRACSSASTPPSARAPCSCRSAASTSSPRSMAMVAKLPVLRARPPPASAMAWGFNPYIMSNEPVHRRLPVAVVESLAKLVAAGFEHEKAYLSFQEYFEKLRDEPERWGKPVAAAARRARWPRWTWASAPSAARTPCPVRSRISTCRRR